jgi:hypothetical protein
MVDALWMYPTALYCQPPSGGIRVPSAETLGEVCLNGQYRDRCATYQRWQGEKLLARLAW